jgi:ribonucleoside-diphosphate reductase alpha chain
MTAEIYVEKRKGQMELLDNDKINKVVVWAVEGLKDVSASQVLMKAHLGIVDGIKTKDLHRTLVKSAADLITEDTPNYQYVAARLSMFAVRKESYGRFTPPILHDHVVKLVASGHYDKGLLADYSDDDFKVMESFIDHGRDLNLAYAATVQMEGKYLVQNRVTKEIFESPQMLYILVAASLFSRYDKGQRMSYVKRFYDAASMLKISLPTPIMAGVRTPTRQYSSCVLIESGDSLDSISAAASAVMKYVSQRAGIGLNAGAIRALGSPIRGGEAFHTGCIPFYKHFQTATKSCSQGGVRGGAATVFYPFWHREFESLVVLKNNRGTDDNRVRHLDYGIQLNKMAYERLIKKGSISFFSPADVPGLYDAFFADQKEFARLYEIYEADDSIERETMKAIDMFSQILNERASTGRIYIQNVDHCNTHSSFIESLAPIKQSNLCMEITLPTKPLEEVNDPKGEVALCTLSAFNLGAIDSLDDLEDLADLVVRALDALLDYQDYPILPAKISTMNRRSLGVGVINFAYYLAKNNVRYSDGSANSLTHKTFEAIQYFLLKASNNLAKEQGACPAFNETKYSQGILPIDTYKKDIDKLTSEPLHYDWEVLRQDILTHGLRNSTVTAQMPSETSSQISNATNGIEPPRGYVSVKASKDGVMKMVVPEYDRLKNQYELLWDIPNNSGYLQIVGIMQKFIDQAISANTNYDPAKFANGRVPMLQMIKDLTTAYKYGVKTLYYHNTRDGASDEFEDDDCETCKI